MKVALSQAEYLEKKLKGLEDRILEVTDAKNDADDELHELYFQKGKLYAELELTKRIPHYED